MSSEKISDAAFKSAVQRAKALAAKLSQQAGKRPLEEDECHQETKKANFSDPIGAQLAAMKNNSGPLPHGATTFKVDAVYLNGIVHNGEKTLDIMIPGSKVGYIIGKGGEMIRNLQERANVKMTVIQTSSEVTVADKQLRIVGDPSKVDFAQSLVNDVLTEKEIETVKLKSKAGSLTNEYGSSRPGHLEVPVSSQYVGLVIGKGGENIRRIQLETGAKVQFDLTKTDANGNKMCIIQGQPDAVNRAENMVHEIVDNAMHGRKPKCDGEEIRMTVPTNRTGAVIGKGGETIRQIKQQSGCDVELEKNSKGVFIIRGPPDRIPYAQQLINDRVQGTPSSPNEQIQNSAEFIQAQSYWQNYWQNETSHATGNVPDSSSNQEAWAAYYAQYYAQYNSNSSNGEQGDQQPKPQPPAPSQSSSQPQGSGDYSKQWAEYYRAYGMHKEAEMIEQMSAKGTEGGSSDGKPGGDAPPVAYPGYNYPPCSGSSDARNSPKQ